MRKSLKVLLLFDNPYVKPRGYDYKEELKDEDWITEHDVYHVLKECGYKISLLGIHNKIDLLLEELESFKPDVVFNLTELFDNKLYLDKNVASLLEMLGFTYTGASPQSLFICNNKAFSKKVLSFHKIKVPRFYTFYRGRRIRFPRRLKLPFVIKPLREEASRGISQASIADNEAAFLERINFIHQHMNMDAIVEEYIDGRELYVSVLGNVRTQVLPFREMKFNEVPEDEPRIATYKAKWDDNYRERWGIESVFAEKLPNGVNKKIVDVCKRAYRALDIKSYARFDIRVTADSNVYIIEANANPCIAQHDEVAQAAKKVGISYNQLIKKIIALAIKRGH